VRKLILLVSLLGAGCVPPQKIHYDLRDIAPAGRSGLATKILRIELFEDARHTLAENELLFREDREIVLNDQRVCINAEKHYETEQVPEQISQLVAAHARHLEIWDRVYVGSQGRADYVLKARLVRLYGKQRYSYGAAAGANLGLIGGVVVWGFKSYGEIEIGWRDVVLQDQARGKTIRLGEFKKRIVREMPIDGACWAIYGNVNVGLRETVAALLRKLEDTMVSAEAASAPASRSSRRGGSPDAWPRAATAHPAGRSRGTS
jgi:hypothetical protein